MRGSSLPVWGKTLTLLMRSLARKNSKRKVERFLRKDIAAFDIDSKVKDGRLALMYRGNTNKPQIWF